MHLTRSLDDASFERLQQALTARVRSHDSEGTLALHKWHSAEPADRGDMIRFWHRLLDNNVHPPWSIWLMFLDPYIWQSEERVGLIVNTQQCDPMDVRRVQLEYAFDVWKAMDHPTDSEVRHFFSKENI